MTSTGREREQLCLIIFVEEATSGARLQWTTAEMRQGEVDRNESTLAKLGGGMMDTALAILMVGIIASHLRIHPRKL
jgi:hypothetical protein